MTVKRVSVRLGVEGGDKVRTEMRDVGNAGQRSLKRIEDASRPASRGLVALNGVTREARIGLRASPPARVRFPGCCSGSARSGSRPAPSLPHSARPSCARARPSTSSTSSMTRRSSSAWLSRACRRCATHSRNTGVDVATTDKAIEKLNDSIGQMALGKDAPQTVQRAFAALGIEIRDTSGRIKTAEVMAEMADGIKNLGSQAERVQVARALMGRGGAAMVPLLQEGTGALRELTDEARDTGAVIDEHLVKATSLAADQLERDVAAD